MGQIKRKPKCKRKQRTNPAVANVQAGARSGEGSVSGGVRNFFGQSNMACPNMSSRLISLAGDHAWSAAAIYKTLETASQRSRSQSSLARFEIRFLNCRGPEAEQETPLFTWWAPVQSAQVYYRFNAHCTARLVSPCVQ
ncbi:hypothetical protein COCSUDRAFT_32507 [Coccomyxa subellipsoidea C-169]|uniref:Uncharacterized protein n=1 Tax=Coccomyxa subellipsoidea (strain C-169) TaxID=574566 RepID=I0Z6A4_COCSC|nr:hypothetical protein COCSUDRAFT_32507 [Coccomyxa subellipsoidea C-169]EIE26173.1 hypothetical protein COCSUDRAFT_32507 [Coccomyxa subellipsoidea C-169]|eukprot:XP_005650717.1 hypothetical protein COCSUDRAFT_32507 [Coccomyxa subellipsoidea C-169]